MLLTCHRFILDPVSLVRDHHIKEQLVELGISVQSYNADLLYEPWEVYDEKGLAFTMFDAYWNNCMHMQMEPITHAPVWRLEPLPTSGTSLCLWVLKVDYKLLKKIICSDCPFKWSAS